MSETTYTNGTFLDDEFHWLAVRVRRLNAGRRQRERALDETPVDDHSVGEQEIVADDELVRRIGSLQVREATLRAALDERLKATRKALSPTGRPLRRSRIRRGFRIHRFRTSTTGNLNWDRQGEIGGTGNRVPAVKPDLDVPERNRGRTVATDYQGRIPTEVGERRHACGAGRGMHRVRYPSPATLPPACPTPVSPSSRSNFMLSAVPVFVTVPGRRGSFWDGF